MSWSERSPANGPAVDVPKLLRRAMGHGDLAAELLQKFADRLPSAVEKISSLISKPNWDRAAREVHKLKGEAATLSLVRLQQVTSALDEALRAGDRAMVNTHQRSLLEAAGALPDILPEFIAQLLESTPDPVAR